MFSAYIKSWEDAYLNELQFHLCLVLLLTLIYNKHDADASLTQ
jgi:hypothetical protein